jgi:uncharacterized protein YjeT (DUF2065 family)
MYEFFIDYFVPLVLLGYGIFFVIWPDKARRMYMAHFDPDSPLKWYNPRTYLRSELPAFVFRIAGIAFILFGLFVLYIVL